MNRILIFLLLLCLHGIMGLGQTLDMQVLDSLANKHYLLYTDKDGNYFGCGMTLECAPMKVVFYSAVLDKKNRRIKAKGRVFSCGFTTPNDTVGAALCAIFLAQPKGDKLLRIRSLSASYTRNHDDTNKLVFPFETGDFEIDFKFSDKDRLYFNTPLYRPLEYNIGTLLKQ